MDTHVALLRVLQERQTERVGGSRAIPLDVRVIAATNRDLSEAIAAGTLRSDLFYRLDDFSDCGAAMRKRREDIPILVEYFVKRFAEKMAKRIRRSTSTPWNCASDTRGPPIFANCRTSSSGRSFCAAAIHSESTRRGCRAKRRFVRTGPMRSPMRCRIRRRT